MKLSELKAIVGDQWGIVSFELNIANISYLYRVASFCRALKIKIGEYLALKSIIGLQALPGPEEIGDIRPQHSHAFMMQYRLIQDVGFNSETLDYLLRHQYRADAPFAMGEEQIGQILLDLQVLINKFRNEAESEGISISEKVQVKLSLLLSPEDVAISLQILEGDSELTLTINEQKNFFDKKLLFLTDPNDAKTKLIDSGIVERKERYRYVLDDLEPYLVDNAIIQQLAETLDISTDLLEILLKDYLRHPVEAALPSIRVFNSDDYLNHDFLNPDEELQVTVTLFPKQSNLIVSLQKIGMLVNGLALTTGTVEFILKQGTELNLPDLANIPFEPISGALPDGSFDAWRMLMESFRINRDYFRGEISVFDIFKYIVGNDASHNKNGLLELLSGATGWDLNDLNYLSGPEAMNLANLVDYRSLAWLVDMADIMPLVLRSGVSAQQVSAWVEPVLTQAHALSVRHAVKAKYGSGQWLEVVAPMRDRIREQQRDALLSFVLHHRLKHDNKPFVDVDDLYGYYLIDPQMSACAQTSRTVLASSSIQLFVQRVQLNLEDVTLTRKHVKEWQWRKYYRVWEANRKVFLWPENWIEPELRDDKSPFFKALENELLQDELNAETVERAYINYLYKLDEVARLQICGVHYETEVSTLHVFARTGGTPPAYFYRRWENRRNWTAWEKVELDIHNAEGVEELQTGVSLLPVVHNRRLFLFWPIFTLKQDELSKEDEVQIESDEAIVNKYRKAIEDGASEITYSGWIQFLRKRINDIRSGYSYYSLTIAYAHYRQGHWSAKKVTTEPLRTPHFKSFFSRAGQINRYFLIPNKIGQEGELRINCFFNHRKTKYHQLDSYFLYDSCKSEMKVEKKGSGAKFVDGNLPGAMRYMKAKDNSNKFRAINSSNKIDLLLRKAQTDHLMSFSLDRNVFKQDTPFLYEDDERTFLVIPPIPKREVTKADSSSISSYALAGKTGQLSESAFRFFLTPPPEPQNVLENIRFIGAETTSNEYFKADDSKRVMIRPAESSAPAANAN